MYDTNSACFTPLECFIYWTVFYRLNGWMLRSRTKTSFFGAKHFGFKRACGFCPDMAYYCQSEFTVFFGANSRGARKKIVSFHSFHEFAEPDSYHFMPRTFRERCPESLTIVVFRTVCSELPLIGKNGLVYLRRPRKYLKYHRVWYSGFSSSGVEGEWYVSVSLPLLSPVSTLNRLPSLESSAWQAS